MSEEIKLHKTMDAQIWTREFMRINPNTGLDEDTIRAWFANAIMCGHDHARWDKEKELQEYIEDRDKWLVKAVRLDRKYSELIMAVVSNYPNETRHQTALKYIQWAESPMWDAGTNQTKEEPEKAG